MRRALHHRAGDGDRVEVSLERGHRSGSMCGPVDDRRVELDLAEHVRLPTAAHARIGRVGLDDLRARFDGVESRAATREDPHARRQRGSAITARDDDPACACHLAAGHPANEAKADVRKVIAREETRRRVGSASENPAAVLPAVRPLAQIAVPLERALFVRGFLPFALVGKPVDAARPDGEPAAVRDRVRP